MIDGYFAKLFNSYQVLNPDVEFISWYSYDYNTLKEKINNLPNQKIIVNISEPTNINLLTLLNEYKNNSNIHFFGDCVLNQEYKNFTTCINWFIDSENFYTTQQWAQDLINKLKTNYNKPYTFDMLLGETRTHRNYLDQLYQASDIKEKFIYRYFGDNPLTGLWQVRIDKLDHKTRNIIIDGYEVSLNFLIPHDIYNVSHYSIVSESSTLNEFNQYTEKIIKPMLAKRPFVVFAGQHYLKNLREQLGFKTFNTVINESYDEIADPELRWDTAWQEVLKLAVADPEEIYTKLNTELEHNRQHFLSTNWPEPIIDFCLNQEYIK